MLKNYCGGLFFLQIFEKISYIWNYIDPYNQFPEYSGILFCELLWVLFIRRFKGTAVVNRAWSNTIKISRSESVPGLFFCFLVLVTNLSIPPVSEPYFWIILCVTVIWLKRWFPEFYNTPFIYSISSRT